MRCIWIDTSIIHYCCHPNVCPACKGHSIKGTDKLLEVSIHGHEMHVRNTRTRNARTRNVFFKLYALNYMYAYMPIFYIVNEALADSPVIAIHLLDLINQ